MKKLCKSVFNYHIVSDVCGNVSAESPFILKCVLFAFPVVKHSSMSSIEYCTLLWPCTRYWCSLRNSSFAHTKNGLTQVILKISFSNLWEFCVSSYSIT